MQSTRSEGDADAGDLVKCDLDVIAGIKGCMEATDVGECVEIVLELHNWWIVILLQVLIRMRAMKGKS